MDFVLSFQQCYDDASVSVFVAVIIQGDLATKFEMLK